MCKCVRDADRLDSLKPYYTLNDVSADIKIGKGAVNLSCTRFKTRIRRSKTQVGVVLHTLSRIISDGNIPVITAHPVQDRPRRGQGTREER